MSQQATQREDNSRRECFIDLVFGTLHCHFSLSICFSTDWKTANECVYIFSSCFTQVWKQLGEGFVLCPRPLAVSPPVCLSLPQLPGPFHPAKPLLTVSPPHSLGFLLGALLLFQQGQQPHHMFCVAHILLSLSLLLSFVWFGFERGEVQRRIWVYALPLSFRTVSRTRFHCSISMLRSKPLRENIRLYSDNSWVLILSWLLWISSLSCLLCSPLSVA